MLLFFHIILLLALIVSQAGQTAEGMLVLRMIMRKQQQREAAH